MESRALNEVAAPGGSAAALLRRLNALSPIAEAEGEMLRGLAEAHIRHAAPREDVVSEGEKPDGVRMILSGWACRYRLLVDGRRQILGFMLPGDVCDHNASFATRMDHSIMALTAVTYARLPTRAYEDLIASCPSVARALACETLSNASIQQEWIVNLGQRVAFERLAHLFCEIFVRLSVVGMTTGATCPFPVTQMDLGDATGLSSVHVNRTLRDLRKVNLVELTGKSLTIPNLEELQAVALFNPAYLHLARPIHRRV